MRKKQLNKVTVSVFNFFTNDYIIRMVTRLPKTLKNGFILLQLESGHSHWLICSFLLVVFLMVLILDSGPILRKNL